MKRFTGTFHWVETSYFWRVGDDYILFCFKSVVDSNWSHFRFSNLATITTIYLIFSELQDHPTLDQNTPETFHAPVAAWTHKQIDLTYCLATMKVFKMQQKLLWIRTTGPLCSWAFMARYYISNRIVHCLLIFPLLFGTVVPCHEAFIKKRTSVSNLLQFLLHLHYFYCP